MQEINSDYKDLLLFTKIRWLSRGKSLERLLNLRAEIANFLESQALTKDSELLNAVTCPEFLLDLAFLTDVTLQINNLNLILQGKNKNICNLFHTVKEFSKKLVILRDQIASRNLLNFPKVTEIFANFPNESKLKMFSEELNKLLEHFKIRFQDISEIEWVIHMCINQLTCSMEKVPINVQLEFTLMRADLSIPMDTEQNFWKNICPNKYGASRDLMLKIF